MGPMIIEHSQIMNPTRDPVSPAAYSSNSTWGTAQEMRTSPIEILIPTTIKYISFLIGTQASGNIDVGLYKGNIGSLEAVWRLGSTACPAAGRQIILLNPMLQLPAGKYFGALVVDNGSIAINYNSWVANNPGHQVYYWTSTFPLPASLTTVPTSNGSRFYGPVLIPDGAAIGQFLAPTIPASTTPLTNSYGCVCKVNVSGGTVSKIEVNGVDTGVTSGTITVPSGQTITLTYSVTPTWTWFGV